MNFQVAWRSLYGDQFPIAYLLRPHYPDSWFRIHSLPESQRYAQNEAEMQEVLRRSNIIADAVLGEGSDCIHFFPNYAQQQFSSEFAHISGELFCRYSDQDAHITLRASRSRWQSHKFDGILRLVANDQIRYVSWMNIASGEIFAPYDGGADLFLDSTLRRDMLKKQYSEWLSKYPQGL